MIDLALCRAILAAAASLMVRFWRARGVERQQLRWVALAAGLAPVAALVAVAASLTGDPTQPGWSTMPPALPSAVPVA